MPRVALLLTAWAALGARPAGAQSWVESVFPERSYDFGTVARGSKVHHTFKIINRTDQEIHIADHRTKCGCTEVHIGAREIPPGTQTIVEAVIDTTKFQGFKASGLTLVIDRPSFAEVDLNLSCFIRGDLVLNPGQVDFGATQRNAAQTVSLILSYAGGIPNWGITRMETRSPHVSARLQEQSRSPDGRVIYLLTANLKPSVNPGYFKDVITLFTNDTSSPTIPVSVTANVQTAVSVSPTIINLGALKPGQVIKKPVLVRSAQAQAFKLTNLKPSRDDLSATPDGDAAKSLHTINLTVTAPSQPGPYHGFVEILTDLKDEPPAKVTTFATIVP